MPPPRVGVKGADGPTCPEGAGKTDDRRPSVDRRSSLVILWRNQSDEPMILRIELI